MPDDHVGGADIGSKAADADPAAGRGLAGDGDVRCVDVQSTLELDGSADTEDDDPIPAIDGVAKTARTIVVEVGDFIDASPAPAGRDGAGTLRAGKCGNVCCGSGHR